MDSDDGSRELGRPECLRLLATAPIGRIVHTRQALPAVVPVEFGVDGDGAVLLRIAAASELARALDGVVVAFEADAVDAAARSGWSVLVTGRAAVVTDRAEAARLERTAPASPVPSREEVFVRIEPELVSGRELVGGRTRYGLHASA
ncbi:pyridoxamine 5'-phosphate oxidase [Streptomyces bungoensis]|uniref:Pyridoxamine 5'-phosphate oxidase n=1 Tax=Streptomyces bungoensis TaxID=285568 RepID=A0A101TA56_9ACTN|nr:pyridoxamine 5'-phosphate oxidase family protein [Streptomyces bungoensis]KUN88506.1 pyridoxamine 5'-phosphate oxidase [Streptomyces bungoensis]